MSFKNDAKALAINTAATILSPVMSKQLWYDAKMFVQAAEWPDDPTLTKEENNRKRHKEVKSKLLIVFKNLGHTILDLAIKLAVLWLKTQIK